MHPAVVVMHKKIRLINLIEMSKCFHHNCIMRSPAPLLTRVTCSMPAQCLLPMQAASSEQAESGERFLDVSAILSSRGQEGGDDYDEELDALVV